MPIGNVFPQFTLPGTELAKAPAEFQAIKESQAKAAESQMLANLLGKASQGLGQTGSSSMGNMDANNALLLAGALKLPTQVVEGKLITPFGTFPIGETPQQKGQREVGETIQKKTGEKNVDVSSTLNTEGSGYLNSMKGYLKLHRLHKENPNLTGVTVGLSEKLKQPLKKGVGEYIGIANDIQANLARSLSQRGGAAATAQAARMKPNIWNPEGTNLGMINANIGILNDKFEAINNEYKAIHGKNMPQYDEFKALYNQHANGNMSQNTNYSPENLQNQAQMTGEGMANVPAPQQEPQNMVLSTSDVQALAKRKGRPVPEIIMRLMKKGYKIEGLNNAR